MRRALMLLPFLAFGCAKTETANTDSAAMAAAPAAVTDADLAGTWKGTAMMAGTDSVIAHWTQICSPGTCLGTSEGQADTVSATYTIMGDSVVGQSQPHTDPLAPGAQVIDHWTLHLMDGKVTGTGHMTLASNPDSVLVRYTFEGTRQP